MCIRNLLKSSLPLLLEGTGLVSALCVCVCVYIASYPDVQKGGGNAWYTLFAHALNLLLDNCIMDASDVDIWAGFC